MNLSNWKLIRDLAVLFLLLGAAVFLLFFFWSIFAPLVISMVLSYLLNPLISRASRKYGVERIWIVMAIYLLFFSSVGLFVAVAIPLLIKEVITVQQDWPQYLALIQHASRQLAETAHQAIPALDPAKLDFGSKITFDPRVYFASLLSDFKGLLRLGMNVLMLCILVPLTTFFLLKDAGRVRAAVYNAIPNRYYELYRNLTFRMDGQLRNFIRGSLTESLIVGIMTSIGFWLIGVKYFFVIGMFAGFANLIPYFGPTMGAIPALIVTMLSNPNPAQQFILIVIVSLTIQFLDNLFIQPLVVGGSVNLHPLVVMFAIMVGGTLFGLPGMVLTIPALSIMKIVSAELYTEFKYRQIVRLKGP